MDLPEGEGREELAFCHYLHRATLLFSRQCFICSPQPFAQSSPPFFVSPGSASHIAARLYCLRSSTSFGSTLSKTKENHSSAHARSLPATELVCIAGCSLSSCSTLLLHVSVISAALLFCSISFFFCFPRYLLWSLAPSLFVSRGRPLVVFARLLLSWNLEFFCFNPELNKRKLLI